MKKKVIGMILTYNSGSLFPRLYRRIPKGALDEIIVVDDGSDDRIEQIAAKYNVAFYTHPHEGYGGNMGFGLKKARSLGADYVVEIHGDGQYDPKVIPAAIKKVAQGYDLLLGNRFDHWLKPIRDGMPMSRYIANIGLSAIARWILGLPLSEFHSGFRIYSRKLLDTVNLSACSKGHLFSFEIIAQARFHGLSIGEIPVRCNYRDRHSSISIPMATLFALQTFGVLYQYVCARWGIRNTPLFLPPAEKE